MKIPYNEELRPDTGLYNAKLGIWLFLASEVMLFGGLFSAYIMLRLSDPNWINYGQSSLNVPLATLNTAVLITSSVTMVMSWVSLKLNDIKNSLIGQGFIHARSRVVNRTDRTASEAGCSGRKNHGNIGTSESCPSSCSPKDTTLVSLNLKGTTEAKLFVGHVRR